MQSYKTPFPKPVPPNGPLKEDQIKNWLEAEGYGFVPPYTGKQGPLTVVCPEVGHQWTTTWDNIRAGHGCKHCHDERVQSEAHRKITGLCLNNNLQVVGNYPKLGKDLITVLCQSCRTERSILLTSFLRNKSCRKCWHLGRYEGTRTAHSKRLSEIGLCLTDNGRWTMNVVDISCPSGHVFQRARRNIENLSGCPTCARLEQVRDDFNKIGLELVDTADDPDRFIVRCSNGHTYNISYYDRVHTIGICSLCSREQNRIRNGKYAEEFLTAIGYKLLGEWVSGSTKTLIRCDQGHEILTQVENSPLLEEAVRNCAGLIGHNHKIINKRAFVVRIDFLLSFRVVLSQKANVLCRDFCHTPRTQSQCRLK